MEGYRIKPDVQQIILSWFFWFAMPKAELQNIGLYYNIYGEGTPLLLIAGLGSDSASWSLVIDDLSKEFQAIVFDNRGTGRSDIGHEAISIATMAEDAIKLLDFLQIEKTHLLGHSMGGYVAQELAIHYPERVDKLVLESTAPVSSKRNTILFDDMYHQLGKEGHCEAWIRRWAFWLFSPKIIQDRNFIDSFINNSMNYPFHQKAEDFKSQINAILSFDARDRTGTIQAKTLIVEGKNDILITPEEAGMLAKGISGSTFHLLDEVAHCIHIENPGLFSRTVLTFLNSG